MNNTAKRRWIRIRLYSFGSASRLVYVDNTGVRIAHLVLDLTEEGRQRDVGPYAFAAADTLQVWQDVGADVHYTLHGEDES